MVETTKYARKPFEVDAVQVTEENLEEIAKWCSGEILTDNNRRYIKVDVQLPLNDRQTKAFAGDWVLSANNGFKVFTAKAFTNSFVKVEADQPQELQTVTA